MRKYNPDADREQRRRRRQHVIGRDFRAWLLARDAGRCVLCGAVEDLTIDHIVPITRGGTTDPDNLRTLCRPCNSAKRDR